MLTVERDGDPRREDLVDVLVPLAVARLGKVRVRELVDERELGLAGAITASTSISAQLDAADGAPQVRHDLEALGERGRLRPVVRLEVADDDVDALELRLASLLEHPIRLPDSGRHSEQDPVTPSTRSGHAPRRLWTRRSISLIPMNGRIIPPRP